MTRLPRTYAEFRDYWRRGRSTVEGDFTAGRTSWLVGLLPPDALELSVPETIGILSERYGAVIELALAEEHTDPSVPVSELPLELQGPQATFAAKMEAPPADPTAEASTETPPAGATDWIRSANVVGVNVRTVGGFFGVVRYLLTVPALYDAIHLLPVWEPGVVGSLYGMSSWEINGEFLDPAFAAEYPHLSTASRQLRAVCNLIHAAGRSLGMDVIPHTDRFSEIALAQPWLFEWLRREDTDIVDHSADLHEEVQERILDYIDANGPAVDALPLPDRTGFFTETVTEAERRRILFGEPADPEGRAARRGELVHFVHAYGYEPAPATMAPPYRGLEVDLENRSVDATGDVWRDYRISEPQSMSRVFGPLARYKFYERLEDNRDWGVDFSRPRTAVWDYVCDHYAQVQQRFGFDFMRGDMSHVQMRPEGVPVDIDPHYDIHAAVKRRIRESGVPWFAYFAETFMAPRGIMAYGDEVDHLDASDAEVTLGDLQSVPINTDEFLQRFRRYLDVASTRFVTPSFTVMTGDKDDPRFDEFYLAGNEVRAFCALFLTDLPSYTGLGFELRDIHTEAAPNEYYTKLYVFQEREGPKATTGPYLFGRNGHLFHNLTRIRLFAEELLPQIRGCPVRWLRAPDPTGSDRFLAWTVEPGGGAGKATGAGGGVTPGARGAGPLLFVANTDTGEAVENFNVPWPDVPGNAPEQSPTGWDASRAASEPRPGAADGPEAALIFSSHPADAAGSPYGAVSSGVPGDERTAVLPTKGGVKILRLEAGECRVYRVRA
jgi:hypothetical protein